MPIPQCSHCDCTVSAFKEAGGKVMIHCAGCGDPLAEVVPLPGACTWTPNAWDDLSLPVPELAALHPSHGG